MRVIRSAGQNVSPADDGRLYSKAFADGLFEDVAISSLGTNLVSIGALYGIICGRDFTAEAQNINVVLPETEGTTEGVIYVEIDISSDDVITIGSALKPFTPTYEDINMNGVVAQMVIAEYTATPVAVTDVTTVYPVATAGGIGSMATIELSPVQNSYAVGDFLVWKGQLYKVTAAIASGETLVIGTNIEAVTIGTELTALNNGLMQVEYADISSTVPNPNGDEQAAVKCGAVVTVELGAGNIVTGGRIATLPTGFRPSVERYIRFGGVATKSSSWEPIAVKVQTDGQVIVYTLQTGNYTTVRAAFTFMI